METKQTAVDFLYEFVFLKLSNEEQMQFEGLFQQAKQMHKEQIIYSNESGFEDGVSFEKWGNPIFDSAEQYYNETYNNLNK
jgi:hypothetical protein